MQETMKVGNELVQVIKDKEFQNITKDTIEIAIDTTIPNGLLKDVPILSTIIGAFNTVSNIKDRLFVKKLLLFLYELKSMSEDKIIEQITKLQADNKYKTKVGEKLLYIIDQCEDPDKASFAGTLFGVYLEQKISYEEFLSATNAIERTPLPDLLYFINNDFDELDLDNGGSEYVSYGLMEIRFSQPKVEIESGSADKYFDIENHAPSDDEVLEKKIKITNFEIKAHVNYIGENIKEYLKSN